LRVRTGLSILVVVYAIHKRLRVVILLLVHDSVLSESTIGLSRDK
jgi:hypothetical protein